MDWTGDELLVWSRQGDHAATYSPRTKRWTNLDGPLGGELRIHGVAGPYFVAAREGRHPAPLEGRVVDARRGTSRPFKAPATVLLEPMPVGPALVYATDSLSPKFSDALLAFDPESNHWSPVTGPTPPDFSRRRARAEAEVDGAMFRWGGSHGDAHFGDGSLLDARQSRLFVLTTEGAPAPRARALSASHGRRVAVWGGGANSPAAPRQSPRATQYDDGGFYDLDRESWTAIPALGDAPWTSQRGAALTESALVIRGDRNDIELLAIFELERQTWAVFPIPEPFRREVHRTGDGLLLLFGRESYGVLDPVSRRWCEQPLPEGAQTRAGFLSLWTGAALIIWGGEATVRSGGCETHTGPEGCDPYVESRALSDGWVVELRRRD